MNYRLLGLIFFIPTFAFAAKFTVSSPSFKGQKTIPEKHAYNGFGCSGENISPAIEWSNAPKGTKSFALTVFDPDAPTGSGWWHWTVANIPANVTKIEEGKIPEGSVEGRTDYAKTGWGGPCPPKGETHSYIFTIYALKTEKLEVNGDTPGAQVGFQVNANNLGKAKFSIKYAR